MRYRQWFHGLVLMVLLLTFTPVQAAALPPDVVASQDNTRTVGVRLSQGTTLTRNVSAVWAADYGDFTWLEVPVSQLPLSLDGTETYQVVEFTLGIHNFRFDPLRGEPDLSAPWRAEGKAGEGLYLVQFRGPVTDAWLQDLRKAGLTPLQYYPQNAYLVWGKFQALESAKRAAYVRWSGVFQPAYKVNPALMSVVEKMEGAGMVENVAVTLYDDGALKTTLKSLEDMGGKYQQHFAAQPDGQFQTVILKLPAARLAEVAGLPAVWALDYVSARPGLDDEISTQISVGNYSGGVPFTGYQAWLTAKGVNGNGVIFADVDTGLDTNNNATAHQDIRGRIAAFVDYTGGATTTDTDGHGTHTGGIIAGNGALGITDAGGFLYGLGMAPQARLVVQNALMGTAWPPAGGWQVLSRDSVLNGAVGSSNSWYTGASGAQGYSAAARTHDFMVRDANFDTATTAEPLIMVFSVGNSGPGASTVTEPKEAKNLIVVGASENYRPANPLGSGCGASNNIERVVDFSSRGPALDGRLLPNIVAPGSDVASLRSYTGSYSGCGAIVSGQTDYVFMSGTSMACPQVSGGTALIVQWWRGLMGGEDPSPAMAKALLINGATPMTATVVPNNNQGWGRMNLNNVIDTGLPARYYDQETIFGAAGETWEQNFAVADPAQPVKVSLVWTDAPGAIGANPALVNDLNLEVTSSGNIYRGNVFSGGWSATGGTADTLNNIENVFLPAGETGLVNVTVSAANLVGDGVPYNSDVTDQDFALVISNVLPPVGVGQLTGTVYDSATSAPIVGAEIQATSAANAGATRSVAGGVYQMSLMTDTYTLTASAFGYQPATINGVTVISGAVTTQNILLTPAPTFVLSGAVTDANTGWPLYARVEVVPEGYPAQTLWTNPWTGVYSLTLPGYFSYTLNVETWDGISGYLPQSREVYLSHTMAENFALAADSVACNAPGYVMPGGFSEGFESTTFPPAGWAAYNVDGDSGGTQWARSTGRYHSGVASAAHFYDSGTPAEDGWLRSPQLTLGAAPVLRFWESVNFAADYEKHSLWVCTTGCTAPPANYTQVAEYSSPSEDTWVERTTNLSAYGGQTVYLAFRYQGENADDWYIDDLSISASCNTPSGGLLAGSVYDANTGAAVTGAVVRNGDGYATTAQTTPEDAQVGEGFYVLYSPSGTKTFTATYSGYQSAVVNGVSIAAGTTAVQDFFLPAGRLEATPDALHAVVDLGASTTRQIVVSNASVAAPLSFEIAELGSGNILVVRRDTAAADAMQSALSTLSYTFVTVTPAQFQAMTVDNLLAYTAVFYAGALDTGAASGVEHTLMISYLDRGGNLYISDNDLGYYHRSSDPTGFYGTYLQSTYVQDNYGDGVVTGLDFMAGLNPDTTADAFPDGFTVGSAGVKLFNAPSNNAAGVAVTRNGYQVVYTSFNFNDIAAVADEVELVSRVLAFFGADAPWLAETPVAGVVPAGGQVTITVSFDAAAVSGAGDYNARLKFTSDTPYGDVIVPVTMTVDTAGVYVSTGSGNWSDLDSWSGSPTALPTAADDVIIAAGTEITVDAAAECHNLTVAAGARLNVAAPFVVNGAVTNRGRLHQEATVNGSGAVDFLMLDNGVGGFAFYGVTLDATGVNLGVTGVDIYGQAIAGSGNLSQTVGTWFEITPENPPAASDVVPVTFWYADSALNGNDPATAAAYHYAGSSAWDLLVTRARGQAGTWEWITAEATAFSPFVIKSPAAPTATSVRDFSGSASFGGVIFGLLLGLVLILRKRL